jgi:hypothetical protein
MKAGTNGSLRARLAVFGGAASCIALLALPVMQATAAETKAEAKSESSRAEMQRKLEAAQKRLDSAAREVADLSMSMSDEMMPRIATFRTMMGPRAVLGLNIGSQREDDRAEGVEVISVSPGGAAAAAGIKAGDVLTEVAGKPLKRDNGDAPRARLLAAMRDVKPEQKVRLAYLRDGKTGSVEVVAQPLADRFFSTPPMMFSREVGGGLPGMPGMPKFMIGRAEGVFGSAELVPLTAKLGQYFGVDKGLLVVRAPEDARLRLEDGDVILDVDGRVPSSPIHALRILSSYQTGEKLKLNVLRLKKRLSFDITIPENRDEEGTFERSNFAPGHHIEMMGPVGPGQFTMPLPPLPPAGAVTIAMPLPDQPV